MEHLQKILYIIFICTFPEKLSWNQKEPRFIIWNIGQGQWVSSLTTKYCIHFDAGGDRPLRGNLLQKLCRSKQNILFISHVDLDHINKISQLKFKLPNTCLAQAVPKSSRKKNKIIQKIPLCSLRFYTSSLPQSIYQPKINIKRKQKSNELSQVFTHQSLLVSGDSGSKQEKIWSHHPLVSQVKYFILGHHGSKTSNSMSLIKKMPQLKMAFASSRKRKYGHPHKTIKQRLKKKKTPLLLTEHWGNIVVY